MMRRVEHALALADGVGKGAVVGSGDGTGSVVTGDGKGEGR
jgi:hypothetical protein